MTAVIVKGLATTALFAALYLLQGYSEVLEFHRQQIISGEIWRLWSSHFVHTNSAHFVFNLVAAILIYLTFYSRIKLRELLWSGTIFATLISTTLLLLLPELIWYNGLSGLLHAFVAYFSVRLAKDGSRIFWAALAMVWLKVLLETMMGAGYGSAVGDMIVITEAHLIGVFWGTVSAFIGINRYVFRKTD